MLPRSFTETVTAQFPKYDGLAGAAFRLHAPSKIDMLLTRPEGLVTLRAEAPYVTVELNVAQSSTVLHSNAWQVIQESLDIYAATHRHALTTYQGEHEYLLWSQTPAGYELTIVDTLQSKWDTTITATVSPPPLIVSAAVNVPAKAAPNSSSSFLPHHEAFRFLRISLLSEDLFDAYRNAYLALECLVSDESAKLPTESEYNWLLRVLSDQLAAAIPGGIDIKDAVDRIYKFGRLPLFHAKTGDFFHLPRSTQLGHIQETLRLLNQLLSSLLRYKFGPYFPGGWAQYSQQVIDGMARIQFEVDEIVFANSTTHECVKTAFRIHDGPRRFGNLWASLETMRPIALDNIQSLVLKLGCVDRIFLTLPESLPMEGVCALRLELNQILSSARAPILQHPM